VIDSDPEIKNLIYISTGGGAMIDYLIDETLPGIEALK
jgi:3-phosphoglycerate kinase